jgi:hypothetical protein
VRVTNASSVHHNHEFGPRLLSYLISQGLDDFFTAFGPYVFNDGWNECHRAGDAHGPFPKLFHIGVDQRRSCHYSDHKQRGEKDADRQKKNAGFKAQLRFVYLMFFQSASCSLFLKKAMQALRGACMAGDVL